MFSCLHENTQAVSLGQGMSKANVPGAFEASTTITCKSCFFEWTMTAAEAKKQTLCRNCLKPLSSASTTGLVRAGDLLPAMLPPELFDPIINPNDIGYTHPVFVQCFLPTRHSARNQLRWQVDCGRVSLVIRAGELAKPKELNKFEKQQVPAGPKARLVCAYVNDAIHRGHHTIDLGESLRAAMEKFGIPTGGKNGLALATEVKNFAAAEITLAGWDAEGLPTQTDAFVAEKKSVRFWIEKDPQQRTLWQPEMTVSQAYYEAVRQDDRKAPFYWPALVALQHDTRAIDIHQFLVYRLRNGLKHPVTIHQKALHAVFGRDVAQLDHFWPRFLKSLAEAHKWYGTARVEVKDDCIVLKDSPPLIPYRKMPRIA